MKPWLPLYLLLTLALTLSPPLGLCGSPRLTLEPRAFDTLLNLALFVPLGLALSHRSRRSVLLAALALSAGIEAGQLFLPRVTSGADLLANALGALLGRHLAPRVRARELPVDRSFGWAALCVTGLALAAIGPLRDRVVPNDLSNWETFPVVIGAETDGAWPWRGTLSELRVYDRALPSGAGEFASGEAPVWSQGGPVLWLRFETPWRARLDGPEGPRSLDLQPPSEPGIVSGPRGLRLGGGRWELPEAVSQHLLARLPATHAFSVTARLHPEDLELVGPARILTFSSDLWQRNFTLAQVLGEVVLRVRTPHAGPNGTDPPVTTRDAPLRGGVQNVVATFGGRRARIHVDGRCAVEMLYLASLGPAPLGSLIAASVVVLIALGGLGAAGLGSGPRTRRAVALFVGAGLVWCGLMALGAWSHLPEFAPIAPGLAVAAALATLPLARRSTLGVP